GGFPAGLVRDLGAADPRRDGTPGPLRRRARMTASRDPVAEIVAYNKPLTESGHRVSPHEGPGDLTAVALRRKLAALAATPFQFFRGTFHLMAWDLNKGRVQGALAAAPEGILVGAPHPGDCGTHRAPGS